jgi:hypothetical protein
MFFIYRLCQLTFGKRAWLVMALFASLPALVVNNHWILTDVPFLFITVAALFCLVLADHRPGATAARLQIGACVLAVASCFIRTAGLANVLGMVMLFLVRRQYRNLIILLSLFALTAVPWQIINARAGHGQPYLEQLLAKHPYFLDRGRAGISDMALRVWKNLQAYATKVLPRMLFLTRVNSWYETFSGIILSLLAAIGFLSSFRKPAPSAPASRVGALQSCAIFAAPVLLCWPDLWANERLLLPFLPLVVIFLFSAVDWFGARLGWRWFAPAFVGVLVLANAVQMTSLARKAVSENLGYLRGDRYSGYDLDWRHYFETIEWIRTHTPDDAVVMARKPEFVYLLSGRRSFCYPMTQDGAQIKSAILRSQYVLFDNFSWTAMTSSLLVPTLRDNVNLWKKIFATPPPEFYVLSINPGEPAGSADP